MKHYFESIGAWPSNSGSIAYAYTVGFVLSLALTVAAYVFALHHPTSLDEGIIFLLALALVQFAVQVVCFLHVNTERASRERLIILGAASLIVLILVSGSLWIMFTLDGRMMPSAAQMEQYMNDQSGF